MTSSTGLRQRKKQQMSQTLWETAIMMFLRDGYDAVTVNQIAAAAGVSKMTVFNYFASKEDLAVHPIASHVKDLASAVRDRLDQPVVEALRAWYLAALDRRDPVVGLDDNPGVLAVRRMLRDTPALAQRVCALGYEARDLLAAEISGTEEQPTVMTHVRAGQIIATVEALIAENLRRLLAGESVDAVHADAVVLAHAAFDTLDTARPQ